MSELLLLLQALLLVAGWILFMRAQTELRAQAARQSLTGETEELRRSVEALLLRLTTEAATVEQRLQTQITTLEKTLQTLKESRIPVVDLEESISGCEEGGFKLGVSGSGTLISQPLNLDRPKASETFEAPKEYKHLGGQTPLYAQVLPLAEQGLTVQEIAKQAGLTPGVVELVLHLAKKPDY